MARGTAFRRRLLRVGRWELIWHREEPDWLMWLMKVDHPSYLTIRRVKRP